MPKRQKSSPATAKAEASAKIEATAKAQWSRHRTSLEFIPPDVTRANARALLDIFSPITQAAGLLGDNLKHKREMRNLEREVERQVAIDQIAKRFDAIRDKSTIPVAPPNKFLYPFIAQASREEPDSPLIEMWARLLASAAEDYDPRYIHLVSVMSRISARQVEIFHEIVSRASDSHDLELSMENNIYTTESAIRRTVDRIFTGEINWGWNEKEQSAGLLEASILHLMDSATISFVHALFIDRSPPPDDEYEGYYDLVYPEITIYRDDQEIDYAILVACGLLTRIDTEFFLTGGRWEGSLTYFQLTTLGLHFAVACQMVPRVDGSAAKDC